MNNLPPFAPGIKPLADLNKLASLAFVSHPDCQLPVERRYLGRDVDRCGRRQDEVLRRRVVALLAASHQVEDELEER